MKNKLRYLGLIIIGLWAALAFCSPVHAQDPLYYEDRGDPADWDYSTDGAELVCDGSAYSLNVSGLVPSDTVVVDFKNEVYGSNKVLTVREYGNSNWFNTCTIRSYGATEYDYGDCSVSYSSPYVDYICTAGAIARITLRGFWRPYEIDDDVTIMGLPICIYAMPPEPWEILMTYDDASCWSARPFTHTLEHEEGGWMEISIADLEGVATDYQKAGWILTRPITITNLAANHVLAYDGDGWTNQTVTATGGFTMPTWITATISGTVPVVITSSYHLTETLISGHDIGIIRSFTYGEAAIAIALFALTALLGLQWLLSLMRK